MRNDGVSAKEYYNNGKQWRKELNVILIACFTVCKLHTDDCGLIES